MGIFQMEIHKLFSIKKLKQTRIPTLSNRGLNRLLFKKIHLFSDLLIVAGQNHYNWTQITDAQMNFLKFAAEIGNTTNANDVFGKKYV